VLTPHPNEWRTPSTGSPPEIASSALCNDASLYGRPAGALLYRCFSHLKVLKLFSSCLVQMQLKASRHFPPSPCMVPWNPIFRLARSGCPPRSPSTCERKGYGLRCTTTLTHRERLFPVLQRKACALPRDRLKGALFPSRVSKQITTTTQEQKWRQQWLKGRCQNQQLALASARTDADSCACASACSCRAESSRKELITSIVAGKSFSLAANVQGQMFAWGTGWAGQLGLGTAKDSRVRCLWALVFIDARQGGGARLSFASRLALRAIAQQSISTGFVPWYNPTRFGRCSFPPVESRSRETVLQTRGTPSMSFLLLLRLLLPLYTRPFPLPFLPLSLSLSPSLSLFLPLLFSQVAPTRVDFPGVGRHLIVRLAAGERHASALALTSSPPPQGWDKDKQWKKLAARYYDTKSVVDPFGARPWPDRAGAPKTNVRGNLGIF